MTSSELDRFEAFVREEFARRSVPGAVVGIRHRGQERVVPCGITNAEHPLPVDERTLFQVASITKTFTATAVMTYVADGRIALDDPVVRHLPDLRLAGGVDPQSLTVEMLLTHRAGWDGDGLFNTRGDPRLEAVPGRVGDLPSFFSPGRSWSYNNAAFSVAGRLVEVLAGEPFPSALRSRVLEPAGIDHAFMSADEVVTHRVAAPHVVIGDQAIVLRGFGWQPGWELLALDVPAGGLITCVPELLRWGAIQLGEIDGPLAREDLAAMHERRGPAGGDTAAMGLAWLHADLGGVTTFGHDGMTVGYISRLTVVPEHELVVVTLTNDLQGGLFATAVRNHALREVAGAGAILPEVPTDPPAGVAVELIGTYDDPFYVLHLQPGPGEGRLFLAQEQRPPEPGRWTPPALGEPTPLAWIGTDRWMTTAPEGGGDYVDVLRNDSGAVIGIRRGSRWCLRR